MAHRSHLMLLAFMGILMLLPEFSTQQRAGGDMPPRFNPDSRPSIMPMPIPGPSTPVPLEIEKQLEYIAQQEEKLEQMKQKLIQQLDKFRVEYMDNILSSTLSTSDNRAGSGSIIMSTLRPVAATTPASDRTTTRLMEIKEHFLEVVVKTPPVKINTPLEDPQLSRS